MSESSATILATNAVVLDGRHLDLSLINGVATNRWRVHLSDRPEVLRRIDESSSFFSNAAERSENIYGVNTSFGALSHKSIPRTEINDLQSNLLRAHLTGVGNPLAVRDVRAGMLLRAHTLMRGASGVRLQLIERLVGFLNAQLTPVTYQHGSIGASGDLVPLSYVAASLIGLDPSVVVAGEGGEMGCLDALKRLGYGQIELRAKEALALINGTSMTTGIAANCVTDALCLWSSTFASHALMIQAFAANTEPFDAFIHEQKAHPGQLWVASIMRDLLDGSCLTGRSHEHRAEESSRPVQDRYAIRCLAQYLGPAAEGLAQIARQVEAEANATTDNPIFDPNRGVACHGGNFLAQYVSVAMDQLRYFIGLLAKHLDVQIGFLVSPEFNDGLPASLIGNPSRGINLGLKGLQLTSNSITPMLSFYGSPLADRYVTHAEQFNQNLNSLGFGSANLSRQSVDLFQQQVAIALLFAIQGVELRTLLLDGHCDVRRTLAPKSLQVYEAVYAALGRKPKLNHPCVFDDHEQRLDELVRRVAADLGSSGYIPGAVHGITNDLRRALGSW